MNNVSFAHHQGFANLALAQAETAAIKAGALSQRARPHVIKFAWDAFDSAIAAMVWTVELGMRFNDWAEDPQNKARINRSVETISVYANRAFKIWSWGVSTAIDAGYNSRPYVKKAIALTKEGVTQATVLIQFLWGLRDWLGRFDYEEVEECQLALPCSPPLTLLAPAKVAQVLEDDPWIAPAENTTLSTAPISQDAVGIAETPLLLAPAPAPKTAKASKRRTRKPASGNRSKKTASSGRKPAKGDLKPAARRKVAAD